MSEQRSKGKHDESTHGFEQMGDLVIHLTAVAHEPSHFLPDDEAKTAAQAAKSRAGASISDLSSLPTRL